MGAWQFDGKDILPFVKGQDGKMFSDTILNSIVLDDEHIEKSLVSVFVI